MKVVVRAPAKPVWHHAHAQTSDEALSGTVVLDQDVVLQPFERAIYELSWSLRTWKLLLSVML